MSPPRVGIHLTVVVWLLLAACPLLVSEWRLSQLAQITSYGIFAMSLAFLWGQTGLLFFGQAIFFGVGAYVMALITKGMVSGVGDSTVIGLLAATLLAALVALAAGLLVFRGRGLSGAYFAIVTLAAAVIAERAASHSRLIGGVHRPRRPAAVGSARRPRRRPPASAPPPPRRPPRRGGRAAPPPPSPLCARPA